MRKKKILFRWLTLASLVTQAACGDEGKLCRSEDMTKEFLGLAPGMNLEGRWRYKKPISKDLYDELEIGRNNLPTQISSTAHGEDRAIDYRYGCEDFGAYPLAVGQRNQHPIPSVFPPDMLAGGSGNGGAFKELLSVDWYDKMLCLAYLTGSAPGAPSQVISRKKTFCFEYRSSDDSIKMSWYTQIGKVSEEPPGKPTSSTIYHRVKHIGAPQPSEAAQR